MFVTPEKITAQEAAGRFEGLLDGINIDLNDFFKILSVYQSFGPDIREELKRRGGNMYV